MNPRGREAENYPKRHIVRAIINHEGNVFMVRRKEEPSLGMIEFPGGGVEKFDSDKYVALKREVDEEIGLLIERSNMKYFLSTQRCINEITYRSEFIVCNMRESILERDNSDTFWISRDNLRDFDPDDFAFDHYEVLVAALGSVEEDL